MSNATPQQDPTPYATAASLYWSAGWRGVLPLPARAKSNPPNGYTGRDGAWPSYPDVYAWTEERGGGNICLRLPPDIIGVDVDHYGEKRGGDVLAQLEADLGPLPPTWRVTSRDDGVSGIRLFRIPVGLRWPGVFGAGIESIRFEHRYAVVWPSIHPEGRTYRWIGPDGLDRVGDVPTTELPDLPQAWVDHFTRGQEATEQPHADMAATAINDWISRRGVGIPCKHVQHALDRGLRDIVSGSSRHDATLAVTNRLIWLAGEGHTGVLEALTRTHQTFMRAVAGDRDPTSAAAEWWRMLDGAVRMAAAAHPNPSTDPCLDPFHGLIPKGPDQWQTPPSTSSTTSASPGPSTPPPTPSTPSSNDWTGSPAPSPVGTSPASASTAPSTAYADAAATTPGAALPEFDPYAEIKARFRAGGSFILDLPDHVPAIWGRGDEVLWADGEALTICGPPGVGKTTLSGQVVRARLVGGSVLGLPVEPTSGRVLYLAMDRPRQIARALRRTLGNIARDVLDDRLIVWPGPPIADVALRPETLLGLCQIAGADTVIIDSIKDAAVGLSNDEVGAGYNRARQMCIAAGVQVLELHHMVKKGDQGSKPTSLADLYGSVWIGAGSGSVLLLSGVAGEPIVQMTHLKQPAEEVGPWRLIHDHQRGETSIFQQADLVLIAKLAGPVGITAKQAASSIGEKDNPTASEIEKARRRLVRLTEQGRLICINNGTGRGNAASWAWLSDEPNGTDGIVPPESHERSHAPSGDQEVTRPSGNHEAGDLSTETSHEETHGGHGAESHDRTPPFREGGAVTDVTPPRIVERSIAGERVKFNLDTGEVVDDD
jgi:hypothetical protein